MRAFKALSPNERSIIIEALKTCAFKNGDVVFRGEESGDKFFIIRTGNADVVVDGEKMAELTDGGFFGEMALLNKEPRSCKHRRNIKRTAMLQPGA